MELRGVFLPEFRGRFSVTRKPGDDFGGNNPNTTNLLCVSRDSSQFHRETFPLSCHRWKAIEVHCNDDLHSIPQPSVCTSSSPELAFNRLQLSDQECYGVKKRAFGAFVAREAMLDEEYWTASWLRAEAHWEAVSYMRHVDNYKRKYAEREFYALKRRCAGRDGNSLKCSCIVTVKKEDKDVKRTILNSVVGTLDLSIRQFLQGETYPGEQKKCSAIFASHEAYDAHKYAYVSNLCVSKFARRQGIASNMLYLATDLATLAGMKQLFIHVNSDNKPAQELYDKTGFEDWRITICAYPKKTQPNFYAILTILEMIEAASSALSKDQRVLMAMRL